MTFCIVLEPVVTIAFKRVVKIVFLSSQIYRSGSLCLCRWRQYFFQFLNDVGGLNMLFVFVGMNVTGISLTTLAFLCILIHAMTDLLFSDSGPAPCGSCGLEVEELGILCDKCLQWFHPVCQNMQDDTYHFHTENLNFSWVCTACVSPNHYVSVTQTPLSSLESVNSFSILS